MKPQSSNAIDILNRIIGESLRSLAAASGPSGDAVEATRSQMTVTTKPIGNRPCCLSLNFDKTLGDYITVEHAGRLASEAETVTAKSRPTRVYKGSIESPEFLPFVEAYLSDSPIMVGLMSMLHHNEENLARLTQQRNAAPNESRLALNDLIGAVAEYDRDLRRATAEAMVSLTGRPRKGIIVITPERKTEVVQPAAKVASAPEMVERCCIRCGATYKVLAATVEKGLGLACSKACSYAHRSEKTREGRIATLRRLAEERKANKQETGVTETQIEKPAKVRKNAVKYVTRNCNACGKTYTAHQAKVDAGKRLTCSMACSYAERGPKISKTVQTQMQHKSKTKRVRQNCLCCGRGFLMLASHIEQGRQITCSKACSYNYRYRGVKGRDPVTGKKP